MVALDSHNNKTMPPCFSCINTLYSRLVARLYDPVLRGMEKGFMEARRAELLRRVHGKVLEVGVGTGANIPFYPHRAAVLAVEPSAAMLGYARERLSRQRAGASIVLLEAGIGEDSVRAAVPEGGFDYIVCTLVLCSIPELEPSLQLFRQWLKPGGQLLVIEHIQDKRQPQRWLQGVITPVWKHLAEGCHLDRPTDELLKAAGFQPVEESYVYRWVPFYCAVLE